LQGAPLPPPLTPLPPGQLKKLAEAASGVESAPSGGKKKDGDGNDESDSGEDGGEKGKSVRASASEFPIDAAS